jgi:hypothetical protein
VTTHVHHLKYRGTPFYFLDKTLDYSKREAVTRHASAAAALVGLPAAADDCIPRRAEF